MNISQNNTYKITNESDLQIDIVNYLRETDLLFCASLGGYLDSPGKRIRSWKDGYVRGQPDLIIYTPSGKYNGMAIELKTPLGLGKISKDQTEWLDKLEIESKYFCLCSNDYTEVLECIIKYIHGIL
jgi:hypothetical protein